MLLLHIDRVILSYRTEENATLAGKKTVWGHTGSVALNDNEKGQGHYKQAFVENEPHIQSHDSTGPEA